MFVFNLISRKKARVHCIANIYLKVTYRIRWPWLANVLALPLFSQRYYCVVSTSKIGYLFSPHLNFIYYFHAQMRCMICFGQLNLYLCIIFDLVVRFFTLSLSLALSLFLNTILAPVFRFQNIRQNGIDFVRIELSENHPKEIPKKLI